MLKGIKNNRVHSLIVNHRVFIMLFSEYTIRIETILLLNDKSQNYRRTSTIMILTKDTNVRPFLYSERLLKKAVVL